MNREMEHARSCNLNSLISLAEEVVKEVRAEEIIADLDTLLAKTNRDPSYIYKRTKRYPRAVVWELTLACNMRCRHCGSSAGRGRRDELTREQAFRLCHELGELESERLTLLGGEPLIHPFWEDITARLQEQGVRVNVITNGWMLADPGFCDRVAKAGFSIVGISIDGLEESHDALRRPGSFRRICRGMDLLAERGLPVAAVTVITRDSLEELDDLYDLLIAKGVKVWQLQLAAPLGRLGPDDPLLIHPQQVQRIFEFLYAKIAQGSGLSIDLADNIGYFPPGSTDFIRTNRKDPKHWVGCMAGIQVLGIDSNGDIKGCQSLPSIPRFVEGNIKTSSLKEIWNDPHNFSYNRKFRRTALGSFCAECRYGNLCRAGCSSTAYAYTGSTGDNPMCLYRASRERVPVQDMDLEQLEMEGRKLIKGKEYRSALRLYQRAIAMRPQDTGILDILGFLCYMTGDYENAREYCERSLEIKPENAYALKGLGLCLVEMNRSEEGIALIREAIQIDPEDPDVHYDLAVVYMKTKQYEKARELLRRVLAIDPNRSREVNRALARLDRLHLPSV